MKWRFSVSKDMIVQSRRGLPYGPDAMPQGFLPRNTELSSRNLRTMWTHTKSVKESGSGSTTCRSMSGTSLSLEAARSM
jgi:hypothetical protein